jgi:alkanesulfonate monooxygenase
MDGDTAARGALPLTTEFLQILRCSWEEVPSYFDGEFFKIRGARFSPRPVGPIPVYLGGASESAVHAAAQYADTYLMWGEPTEAVAQQLAVVRSRTELAG